MSDEQTGTGTPPEAEDWGAPISGAPKWDPSTDGDLIGTILSREDVELQGEAVVDPDTGEIPSKVVGLYVIRTDTGDYRSVWESAVMARSLPAHVGHRVKIEDAGLIDLGNGQKLRDYRIYCATDASRPGAPAVEPVEPAAPAEAEATESTG